MVKFEEILNDEEIEIARAAYRDALDLLGKGFVADVFDQYDELSCLYTRLAERVRDGDAWAIHWSRHAFARLHGVAAALGWDV